VYCRLGGRIFRGCPADYAGFKTGCGKKEGSKPGEGFSRGRRPSEGAPEGPRRWSSQSSLGRKARDVSRESKGLLNAPPWGSIVVGSRSSLTFNHGGVWSRRKEGIRWVRIDYARRIFFFKRACAAVEGISGGGQTLSFGK